MSLLARLWLACHLISFSLATELFEYDLLSPLHLPYLAFLLMFQFLFLSWNLHASYHLTSRSKRSNIGDGGLILVLLKL